jgi:hypothetical protein
VSFTRTEPSIRQCREYNDWQLLDDDWVFVEKINTPLDDEQQQQSIYISESPTPSTWTSYHHPTTIDLHFTHQPSHIHIYNRNHGESPALTLLAAVSSVAAFPQLMELDHALSEKLSKLDKRAVEPPPRAPVVPVNRPNTGLPPLGFNAADQYVDTSDSGPHPFKAPGPGDRRGQCPGYACSTILL